VAIILMNKPENSLGIHAPLIVIMLFQIAALFCRSFLQRELTTAGFEQEFAKNLSYLVVPVIELALLWPILKQNRKALLILLRIPPRWPRIFLSAVLLGLLARFCGWSVLITATAFGGFDFSPPGQGNGPWIWFACPPPPMLFLGLLVTVVLIPPGEEIINRGLIFGQIARRDRSRNRSRSRAVITSAALFAILHNPEGMAAAFAIGIMLAIQTCQTGSLLPSIVTHGTYNLLRIVDWYCMHVVWNPEMRTNTSTAVGVGSMVLGTLAFGFAIWVTVRSGSERITRPDPGQ
jgi:membrane protease YdiL (CAAX protease family)